MDATLIDSNVFIRIFAGDAALLTKIQSISSAINTVVWLELIQGKKQMMNGERLSSTSRGIRRFISIKISA